ncbi:MAG: SusD/RagB family nutrient-binding outer membrane lipoprotein [Sphingobacteriales bacterium]|nr:SusD/RagB family nutrient-binding outer membrane lipoprotein [Sphingobacteriales bacterium]
MKKTIFAISSAALLAVSMNSCTKKIDEAYANPNADVRVPIERILPPIISTMAANAAGHGPLNDIRFIGKFVQNFLFCNSGGEWDRMGNRPGTDNAASMWRIHFFDIGQNCNNMIKWGIEEKKWDYAGVGKAILAWSWLTLTDIHGEVISPREAFNTGALTFAYGTQEEVYAYVRTLCHESLNYLNTTGDNASQQNLALGDQYFYNGDVNKWKLFVYGILARSFHHLTNKAEYQPDSVIYYCNQSITTNANNATVKFANTGISGTANFFGPFRGNLGSTGLATETAIRQSAFIANLLSGSNSAFPGVADPRAIYLIRRNTNGTFKGLTPNKGQTVITANDRPENFHGVSQAGGVVNTSPTNDNNCRYIFRNASEFPVLTASEIAFIKAEALFRKEDKAGALAAYKDGIRLNLEMLKDSYSANVPPGELITTTTITNFLDPVQNPTVIPSDANDITLTHIMMQKYIALYVHGAMETWVDMRRFHYTDNDPQTGLQVYRDFTPPSGSDLYPNNNGKLIYRLRPRFNSEYVWNLNELTRIGAVALDYHTKEQWFSQQ